jgi:hypothetical protein
VGLHETEQPLYRNERHGSGDDRPQKHHAPIFGWRIRCAMMQRFKDFQATSREHGRNPYQE